MDQHKVWLLDAISCIMSAMSDCPLSDKDQMDIFKQLMPPAAEFCFETKVRLGKTVYEKWSELRPKLRDIAAATALSRVGALGDDGDPNKAEQS
eukprot:335100-Pyramimonas_sp.AAC.1